MPGLLVTSEFTPDLRVALPGEPFGLRLELAAHRLDGHVLALDNGLKPLDFLQIAASQLLILLFLEVRLPLLQLFNFLLVIGDEVFFFGD